MSVHCSVPEAALFSVCAQEGECMNCLPQHSHALLPAHVGVEPGSGSGLQLWCGVPAALRASCTAGLMKLCFERARLVPSEHLWDAL